MSTMGIVACFGSKWVWFCCCWYR